MSQKNIFNCFLVGSKSSGRGSFLCHHIPGYLSFYNGGISGVMMHPLKINTSVGNIQFNIWDIDGLHGKCIVPTDCAIIFESVTNGVALETCQTVQADVVVVIESIKLMVACADEPFNSFGDLNAAWMEKAIKKSMQLDYNNLLGPESPHNLEKIFLWLSQKLRNDKNIEFLSYPVFSPRFFIKAQKTHQGFCCQVSSTSSSSSTSESEILREEGTESKSGGDSKSTAKESGKSKSNEEEEEGLVKNNEADTEEKKD